MIYGAILEKGEKFFTDMRKVFHAINHAQKDYHWLVTDFVCYPKSREAEELLSKEYCWLSGEELTAIVNKENFQWIWAVLSGFKNGITLEQVLKYSLPYADGYAGFWENPITMQHPLASIEIVPWDSSLTLVISKEKDLVDAFRKRFPQSEDLSQYNARAT